jgi:hypothetical protein
MFKSQLFSNNFDSLNYPSLFLKKYFYTHIIIEVHFKLSNIQKLDIRRNTIIAFKCINFL